jgi:hypothetical protein
MRRLLAHAAAAACALCLVVPSTAAAQACSGPKTLIWIGGSGDSWGDAANWSPACAPDAQSSVTIPSGGPMEVQGVTGTVAALTMGVGARINGTALTVTGTFHSLTGATDTEFDNHIRLDVTVGGAATLDGSKDLFIGPDATLTLDGPSMWIGGDTRLATIQLNANGRLELGGQLYVAGQDLRFEGSVTGRLVTKPTGSILFDSKDTSQFHGVTLENNGTVSADTGRTLTLDASDLVLPDGGKVGGAGTIRMTGTGSNVTRTSSGGAATIDGRLRMDAGALDGIGRVAGNGRFVWNGGTLDGRFTFDSGVTFETAGDGAKFVEGVDPQDGLLIVRGPSSWGGTQPIHLKTSDVVLRNEGTMTLTPGAPIDTDSGAAQFDNIGTLTGTGSIEAESTSPGVVDPVGALTIEGPLSQTGRVIADVANGGHDTLTATGDLTLGGVLQTRTAADYAGAVGTRVPVVRGDSRTGTFASLEGADFASDRRWTREAVANGEDLVVVARPATGTSQDPITGTEPPPNLPITVQPAPPPDLPITVQPAPTLPITVRPVPLSKALTQGLPITVRPSAPGVLRVDLMVPRSLTRGGARAAQTRLVRVGRATRTVAAGTVKLRVKFTKKAARSLRRPRRLPVTVRITLREASGRETTQTKRVTLKR